eukprot:7246-Heterococcus_DN1.PRE.1
MLDFEFCAQEESSACVAPCCSSFAAGRHRYAAVPERPSVRTSKDPNGSCNELLEPEVVTPAAHAFRCRQSTVDAAASVSAIQLGLSC